jgi:hypothetical protein
VLGAGLEIGVGCEHDDLRLRSQLSEPRRGIKTGEMSGQAVTDHDDLWLCRSQRLPGLFGGRRNSSEGEAGIHGEDGLDKKLNIWVVLDDHEHLHGRGPSRLSCFRSIESRLATGLALLSGAKLLEILDLLLQLDHLELPSDGQPLEPLEFG